MFPTDIEKIIMGDKVEMEVAEKMKCVLEEFKNTVQYKIHKNKLFSLLVFNNKAVEYVTLTYEDDDDYIHYDFPPPESVKTLLIETHHSRKIKRNWYFKKYHEHTISYKTIDSENKIIEGDNNGCREFICNTKYKTITPYSTIIKETFEGICYEKFD